MRPSRRTRLFAALFVLFSLLFTQVALSAYACPLQLPQPAEPRVQSAAMDAMPGCTETDKQAPSLCDASTQPASQSAEHGAAPQVQPFIPARMLVQVVHAGCLPVSAAPFPSGFLDSPGGSPPIAILHCRLRN